ncbi:MAG: hypothetical protein CNLJKLNK_00304 [Holosporales bacterium]
MKNKKFLDHVINEAQSIICLNSHMPEKNIFPRDKIYIAADGGSDKLVSLGITPHVVVGDFDSIKSPQNESKNIINKDENFTDFEKVLTFIGENKLFPSIVFGVNGGDIDRILHNIMIAFKHEIPFYCPPILGLVLEKSEKFFLDHHTKISIFGQGTLNTTGLKWDLDHASFIFPEFASCSNRTEKECITFEITKGKFLILIYI